jgi:hypothetical protein
MNGAFGVTYEHLQPKLFLSAGPSATKHGPNITAFRQGVRDEKMLEKLATHDVETVTMLFALDDKCARAVEGRAWHSAP